MVYLREGEIVELRRSGFKVHDIQRVVAKLGKNSESPRPDVAASDSWYLRGFMRCELDLAGGKSHRPARALVLTSEWPAFRNA